jgi:DeoR family fructose operon transcriptional repressor
MASSSIVKNRRDRILGILNHRGDASVDELSADLGVSLVTIRRDLDFLDSQGMLIRKHGGAQSSAEESDSVMEAVPEKKLEEKDSVNIEEKTRIAEKAAALVKDGDIIFTNSGSTILTFIASIRSKRVKVITNHAAAITMKRDPGMELIILGGEYREQSRSFVGEFAVKMIKDIYSGYTFLGVNGLSLERGLMTSVYQECSINQAMIANTHEKVVVLADYSKMGKVSNFVSSPLSSVDIVITDDKCPDQLAVDLERLGIRVIIA